MLAFDPYSLFMLALSLVVPPFIAWRLLLRARTKARHKELASRAERKRQAVAEALAQAKRAGLAWEGFLAWSAKLASPPSLSSAAILDMTATDQCRALANGTITSEYLVRLYIARSILVNERLNCVTEQRYEAAVAEAQKCDAERRATGDLRGPLHGLPVSIKEQVGQAGFDSTCGACCRLERPCAEDATLVSSLVAAGAIPFCRTNVPQLLMLPETFNAIYGNTNNPFDLSRTPGGSSGGEGALVAACGSPLGLGTDVGGSIRIPAVFNGICGFKPTNDRLSYKGISVPRLNNESGQREVKSSPGPLGRCVADLETMMQAMCCEGVYAADLTLPPLPWDRGAYEAAAAAPKLRFGYYVHDGWFAPSPACERAVLETVEALRAAGHEVVPFEPTELAGGVQTFLAIVAADGNFRGFVDGIEGEELHPTYSFLQAVACIPGWLRPIIAFVQRRLLGQPRLAKLVLAGGGKTAHEYWQTIAMRDRLKKAFLARYEKAGLDALLCPGLGVPPFSHGKSVKLNQACSYTFVYNNFNLPAGTVPVTTVKPSEQYYRDDANPDSITSTAIKDSASTAGLPVGVQVVGLPWREERCLGAMKIVEGALRAAGHVPPTPPSA
jgi:fatty acid amide hydrolase